MEATLAHARQLRKEAETYRRFAEEVFSPELRQAAQDFADEADEEAGVLEELASHVEAPPPPDP